jgi:hypothetical protein
VTVIGLLRKAAWWLLFGVLRLIAVLCAVQIVFFIVVGNAAQHSDGLFYVKNHDTLTEVSAMHSFVLDHLYWLFFTVPIATGTTTLFIPRLKARRGA